MAFPPYDYNTHGPFDNYMKLMGQYLDACVAKAEADEARAKAKAKSVSKQRARTNAKVQSVTTGLKFKNAKSGYKVGNNIRVQPHSKDANVTKHQRPSPSDDYESTDF